MLRKIFAGMLTCAMATGVCLTPVQYLSAQSLTLDSGFDPNFILTDDDIFNPNAMTFERLVAFLRSKGTLGDYRTLDTDGTPKTAAEIIWRVSRSYAMNPKYLVALIQKEQSLVEDPNPSQNQFDWATGYAVCDDCSKNDPDLAQFKGFASQLEWAAKQHREKYLMQLLTNGLTIGGQGKGKTVAIDGVAVTPTNQATAMLYSYTPHLRGNMNLWRIWKRWFTVAYPDGTVVQAMPSKKTYLLRFGEKRMFASPAVVSSRVDPAKIIRVSDTDVASYPDGPILKFSPYSLLKDEQGRIYLLTAGDEKRHIASMDAFHKFGFNEDEIEDATSADLAAYPDGQKINTSTSFPQGVLMKLANAPGVWYIEDGKRHALLDASLLRLYFRGRRTQTVTKKTLESYELSEPYKLHDGELVKTAADPVVYVVENGVLRPIPSGDIFETVGWKWKNVITVPARLIAAHDIGAPFVPDAAPQQLALGS